MPNYWHVADDFLLNGGMGFGEDDCGSEVWFSSYTKKGHTTGMIYDCSYHPVRLAEGSVCQAFPLSSYSSFLLPTLHTVERSYCVQPTLREWVVTALLLDGKYMRCLEFFNMGHLSFLHLY